LKESIRAIRRRYFPFDRSFITTPVQIRPDGGGGNAEKRGLFGRDSAVEVLGGIK